MGKKPGFLLTLYSVRPVLNSAHDTLFYYSVCHAVFFRVFLGSGNSFYFSVYPPDTGDQEKMAQAGAQAREASRQVREFPDNNSYRK